jgi:dienelactone hydrolase
MRRSIPMVFATVFAVSASCMVSALPKNGDARVLAHEEVGFAGRFHPVESTMPRRAVLVLGGAEGGVPDELAAPLLGKGSAVLALAYFKADGLPAELERIPLEYVDHAMHWLRTQPGVAADDIAIVGWSKGAELALVMAARDPGVSRVVAIAPSHVMWAGILSDWTKVPGSSWTLEGQPMPSVPFDASGQPDGLRALYEHSLRNTDAVDAAAIPIERSAAHLLLLSGGKDEVWPSSAMADALCQRAAPRAEGLRCEHRSWPMLGHLLDDAATTPGHDIQQRIARFLAER